MGMACGKCRSHANPRMHSVAYGSFLLTRIRTTTWKAQDAFHTYAQGRGAEIYPTKAKSAEGRKNVPCLPDGEQSRNTCPERRYHWPLLR